MLLAKIPEDVVNNAIFRNRKNMGFALNKNKVIYNATTNVINNNL